MKCHTLSHMYIIMLRPQIKFELLIFRSEADVEPPVKKPKSNGSMKEEKPFITDAVTDIADEVQYLLYNIAQDELGYPQSTFSSPELCSG